MTITKGTKTPDTLSAKLAIGALLVCAASTKLIICDRREPPASFSTKIVKLPCPLMLAP